VKAYSIELEPKAERQLLRLELQTRRRMIDGLKGLAEWPVPSRSVKPLKGQFEGMYRLRVGRYRAVFAVDHSRRVISVREIGHRGSVYK